MSGDFGLPSALRVDASEGSRADRVEDSPDAAAFLAIFAASVHQAVAALPVSADASSAQNAEGASVVEGASHAASDPGTPPATQTPPAITPAALTPPQIVKAPAKAQADRAAIVDGPAVQTRPIALTAEAEVPASGATQAPMEVRAQVAAPRPWGEVRPAVAEQAPAPVIAGTQRNSPPPAEIAGSASPAQVAMALASALDASEATNAETVARTDAARMTPGQRHAAEAVVDGRPAVGTPTLSDRPAAATRMRSPVARSQEIIHEHPTSPLVRANVSDATPPEQPASAEAVPAQPRIDAGDAAQQFDARATAARTRASGSRQLEASAPTQRKVAAPDGSTQRQAPVSLPSQPDGPPAALGVPRKMEAAAPGKAPVAPASDDALVAEAAAPEEADGAETASRAIRDEDRQTPLAMDEAERTRTGETRRNDAPLSPTAEARAVHTAAPARSDAQRPAAPTVTVRTHANVARIELSDERPQHLTLDVDPPELGRCELDLSLHEGRVRATVIAHRPETVLALRAVEGQVREQLAARQLHVAEFDVRAGAQHTGQQGSGHGAFRGGGFGRQSANEPPAPALRMTPLPMDAAPTRRPALSSTIDLVA